MNKTVLIFRHEFQRTLKRTGFIILTLALPVLALLAIGVTNLVSGITRPPAEETRIGYVDQAGGFDQPMNRDGTVFVRFGSTQAATAALTAGKSKSTSSSRRTSSPPGWSHGSPCGRKSRRLRL